MDRKLYLEPLEEMKKIMIGKNSPLAEYIKVLLLARIMMKIEDIYEPQMDNHPYPFTAKLINETIDIFKALMSIERFENKDVLMGDIYGKEKNVIKKHKLLWQEIWPRHDNKEFQELIDYRGARLDANKINKYVKNRKCIDFGCGNGNFSFALLERGAKSVYGIDFGDNSIRYANEMAKLRKEDKQAKFETKDILNSNLADSEFEFALCSAVLHHLSTKKDMAFALKEIARVLKPESGFFIYVTGSGAISIDLREACVEILSDVENQFIENILLSLNLTRGKMVHITDSLTATYLQTEPEELMKMLTSAGFSKIRRLKSAAGDPTSWDINVVEKDTYGAEKYGSGELRYFCVRK